MLNPSFRTRLGVGLAGFLALAAAGAAHAAAVNIYSDRQEHLIKPQLDAFKTETGIDYRLFTGDGDALIERLRSEGRNSPADVLLTVDVARLHRAKELGLFQPVRSKTLEAAIPAPLRDPQGHWFGLGQRLRTVFYALDRVDPSQIRTYEDLAAPQWKGRLLVRSSSNVYNQSLLAALIHHYGPARAEAWARGIVANMARNPKGGDTDQLLAVAAGQGDIAIANHYYYVRLLTSDDAQQRAAAAKIRPAWLNQADHGAHVNVSGGGITASAPNAAEAVRLLEFLVSDEAQRIYAEVGHEFPVKPDVPAASVLDALGTFKSDDIPLSILGENNAEAVRTFDRVGWR